MHALRQYKYTHITDRDNEPCRYASIKILLTESVMNRVIAMANKEGRSVHEYLRSAATNGIFENLEKDEAYYRDEEPEEGQPT